MQALNTSMVGDAGHCTIKAATKFKSPALIEDVGKICIITYRTNKRNHTQTLLASNALPFVDNPILIAHV